MNSQSFVATLLALRDESAIEGFLGAQEASLTSEVMGELEARVNRLRLEDPNEALRVAEVMLLAAGCLADERVYANALRLKGNVLIHLGRYEESITCYQEAKPIRVRYGEQLEVARLQVGWTGALIYLAHYDEALQLALATREILLEHEKWAWLANLEMNIGSIYRLTDRYDKALAIYEQGRQHFELAGNPVGAAQIQVNASRLMGSQDRFHDALALLHKVHFIFKRHQKSLPLARTNLNLALLSFRTGRYEEAWERYNQAKEGFKLLDNEMEVANVDLHLSRVYLSLNLFPEGLQLAQNAQSTFEKRGMTRHVALAELSLATAHRELGDEREAERLFQNARSFFTADKGPIWAALIDLQWAALLRETDRQSEAIPLLEQAIELFASHKLSVRLAQARLLLAECYYDLEQIAHAQPLYEAILKMPDELRLPTLAYRAYYGLGRVAEAQGEAERALDSYQAAIKEIESIRHSLRVDEFKASFLDDKLALYQAAVRLSVEMAQLADAFDYVEQAKSSALLDLLARNLELRAEEGAAVDSEAWERLRRLKEQWLWHHSKLEQPPVEEQEQTRWAKGMDNEAWEELRRVEVQFNQLWRQLEGHRVKSLTAEAKHSWQNVRPYLDPDTILVEYFFIEEQIVAFLLSPPSIPPNTRGEVSPPSIPPNTTGEVCCEGGQPHVGGDRGGANFPPRIGGDRGGAGLRVVRDFPYTRREIERSLYALEVALKGLSGLDPRYVKEVLTPLALRHLSWLYEALIAPLMPTLAAYRKVIIVPDDLLYALPFHALHDGEQYLIDRFEVQYAPSASVLALCHQTKAAGRNCGLRIANCGTKEIRNPKSEAALPPEICNSSPPRIGGDGGGAALVMGYSHGGRLPHVVKEVQAIASTLSSALLFEEKEATLAHLRQHASDCNVLHLASHATFREDNPLFSYLELADEPLNVIDIYHLKLNASLVTLSACETGMNQLTGGDLFGLARGCFYAGTPSLVASLWQVDDASTALLMQEFYRRLQAGEPIARALRAAQLALRQSAIANTEQEQDGQDGQLTRPYDHPHYWAPFFLMGADGEISLSADR
ncbi:MAG: CHAT domain-containing protein [Ardenticatenaceae bacterium]